MRRDIAPAALDLLLLTHPLIALVRGDMKTALRRAWINLMNNEAAQMLGVDEGRLPQSPRAASEALMRAVIEIAKAEGMTGAEIADFFNAATDGGLLVQQPDADGAVARGFALLGVFAARRMTIATKVNPEDERTNAA